MAKYAEALNTRRQVYQIRIKEAPQMKFTNKYKAYALASIFMPAAIFLASCSNHETVSKKDFVGKWQSSKMETPLYLYENNDWEIKKDDGTIVQYGIWEYKDKKMIWSYKIDAQIGHDINQVVTVTPGKFQLRESDQTLTSFNKLD
jgi:hypothetical protein